MGKKYRLVAVNDKQNEWDCFIRDSGQGTIYSCSKYLDAVGSPYALYFVYKGHEVKAGIALQLSNDGKLAILNDFVVYNGIIFRANRLQKEVKAKIERFEITEFVVTELVHLYSSIAISLHPGFEDMRPFLWHNYNDASHEKRCSLDLRYTSFLPVSEFFLRREEEQMSLYENLDNIRQSDIRKARKDGVIVREEPSCIDLFIEYYSALMSLQGEQVSDQKLLSMQKLVQRLISDNLAKLFVAVNKTSHQISYITVFTLFENRATYLFGAGRPGDTKRFDGTICLWDSFKILSTYGIQEIDMEGINSPQRGSFKLGFGGTVTPYYHVSFNGSVEEVSESERL